MKEIGVVSWKLPPRNVLQHIREIFPKQKQPRLQYLKLSFFSTLPQNWHVADFYASSLKGPPGASSNRSVCLSVIPSCLQTKCNILSSGGDTVTKLGL